MINLIYKKQNYILCQYTSENSPYDLNAQDFIYQTEEGIVVNKYDSANHKFHSYIIDGTEVECSNRGIVGITYFNITRPADTGHRKYNEPLELELKKYYKKRQVEISTYCAIQGYKNIESNAFINNLMYNEFTDIFNAKVYTDVKEFRKDALKDYIVLEVI